MTADPVLAAAMAAGRTAHLALMVDACVIRRPGTPVLNRATSVLTPGSPAQLYSGPCRLKSQRMPRDAEAGEEHQVIARYELALPFDAQPASALAVGDEVLMTASGDARLVDRVLHVLAVDYGTTSTCWRLTVQDQTL